MAKPFFDVFPTLKLEGELKRILENAEITKAILKGEERGPKRQAVCLNAGAALYIAGKAASIEEGVKLAESLIDSGAALKKLEEFVEETNK